MHRPTFLHVVSLFLCVISFVCQLHNKEYMMMMCWTPTSNSTWTNEQMDKQ